jgi:hypothetical protein
MIIAFAFSCFLVWLMLSRANPATMETIDPKSLIKSQEIIQGGDAGGVYVPKKNRK